MRLSPTTSIVALSGAALLALPATVLSASFAQAATVPSTCASVGVGARGAAVTTLQRAVGAGADGNYGPLTAAKVQGWQHAHRLPATGTVDGATWAALPRATAAVACGQAVSLPRGTAAHCTSLRTGNVGMAVAALQRRLRLSQDGQFGPLTARSIRAVQAQHRAAATGIADGNVWAWLGMRGTPECAVATAAAPPAKAPAPVSATVAAQQAVARTVAAQVAAVIKAPAKPSDAIASRALAFARAQLGVRYLWGGTTRAGYDCSGLTYASYAAAGMPIGRVSTQQYAGGKLVALSDLRPGDIVFYASNLLAPNTTYHNAMYAGAGRMIESPHAGVNVRLVPLRAQGLLPRAARPSANLVLPVRGTSAAGTVRAVQAQLVAHGYRISVDGGYGPATTAAVRTFQARTHLRVTGVVDTATWSALSR